MRTIPSPRARAVVTALRTQPAVVVTAAVLATGLVAGVVSSAQSAPSASRVGLSADKSSKTYDRVSNNLLATRHFEERRWPWVGSRVSRQNMGGLAPDGKLVGRASYSNGRVSIDDWPGETKSVAGWRYRASVTVRAANHQSLNKPFNLVIREHDKSGKYIASSTKRITLTYTFRQIWLDFYGKRSGDTLDVYAWMEHPQQFPLPSSAFLMDNVYLWAAKPITPKPPPPPPGSAPSTLGLLAYATGQPTALGNTSRYKYVVVQENQFGVIPAIKRMNPNTKVLAYMQGGNTHYYSSCSNTTSAHLYGDAYGVSYCWANRYHPDWFLKDRSGNRLHTVDYSFLMPMDVGNPSFASAWASGTYANLKKDGFDGVWMDDVNIDPGHGLNGRIAKYSDEQYGAATTKWASSVGDYMRSHGMIAIANVGLEPWVSYQLSDVLTIGRHLTAVNREHYVRYGDICGPFGERFNNTATNGTPPLSSFFNETRLLQAQGTKITGVDYGYTSSTSDDQKAMTYGRALFLLSWDGSSGSAYFYRRCGVNDTAASQWTADVGMPTGSVRTDSKGLLYRNFQHGMVVLNPNRGGSAAKVSVPAGLHPMSGATQDGGVYVAPQTAAILSS